MLVDAHCHVDRCKRPAKEVIAGDVTIISNGTFLESNKKVLSYAKMFPNVRAALGLFPTDALKLSDKQVDNVLKHIADNKDKIVAVGEVGIDFYWILDQKEQKREIAIFKKVVKLANKIKKPLIVHSRKCIDVALEILKDAKVPVVMHSFEGNQKQTNEALERGYYFTVPTKFWERKNWKKTARRVPIDRLLTETDSPWLSPTEGENRPINVKFSVIRLAELKGLTEAQVKDRIWKNFVKLFEPRKI